MKSMKFQIHQVSKDCRDLARLYAIERDARILLFPTASDVAGKKATTSPYYLISRSVFIFIRSIMAVTSRITRRGGLGEYESVPSGRDDWSALLPMSRSLSHVRVNPRRVRRARSLSLSVNLKSNYICLRSRAITQLDAYLPTIPVYRTAPNRSR